MSNTQASRVISNISTHVPERLDGPTKSVECITVIYTVSHRPERTQRASLKLTISTICISSAGVPVRRDRLRYDPNEP